MARLLDLDPPILRARLVDLRGRGILFGPFQEGDRDTWKSWFPTVAATVEAAARSGLRGESAVPLNRSWWGRS